MTSDSLTTTVSSRRHFLRCACTTGLLLAIGAPLSGCADSIVDAGPSPTPGNGIDITANAVTVDLKSSAGQPLGQAGGFLFFSSASIIAINDGGTIRAFTSVCTHQGFPVNRFNSGRMVCSGHGAQFDTSGQVVSGPAPSSLREFGVTRSGDTVTISRG
jgi:cytochrome b6-f complex iron-sulfur subunit